MIKPNWMPYHEMYGTIERLLDQRDADQTVPSQAQVFDVMFAMCCVAGPEDPLDEKTGDFTSAGHAVIYERWKNLTTETCECDGWVLTCGQNDSGYSLEKIGDATQRVNFSHDEPWEGRTTELLERTYWRVLNVTAIP